jgi:hypothetical protein
VEVVVAGDAGHVKLGIVLLQQCWPQEEGGQPDRQGKRTADGDPGASRGRMLSPAVDQPQHDQVGQEEGGKEQTGDVVGQEQGGQRAGAEQKPAPMAGQGQAAEGPQDERQKWQRDCFGHVGAQEGVEELVGGVGVGDGSDDARPGAKQVAGQEVHGEGGAGDAQRVQQVEGHRECQAGQVQRQRQVVRQRSAVVEEWVPVAERQVGKVAGEGRSQRSGEGRPQRLGAV